MNAVQSADALIEGTGEIRGPDGKVKATFTLRGTTKLSEQEVRSALGMKGLNNGSDSLDGGAQRSG